MQESNIIDHRIQNQVTTVIQTGFFILSSLALSACATAPGPDPVSTKPGTTYGRIYVDTPEVYSRERLVNDRFRQDAWLREKLGQDPVQGVQGGIGSSSSTSTQLALAAGVKPASAPREQVEKSSLPQEFGDTPVEQLRDAMAYREEVRNEILENQLDDRHDIAGNTLYRLKFDTTVVPLRDTSAYAMVEVTVRGSSFWDMSGEFASVQYPEDTPEADVVLPDYDFARYVTGLDEATMEFYSRVYFDWERDINPHKYSEEEVLFGPLQAYFVFDEFSGDLLAKVNCEVYDSEEERQAAVKELTRRGVPIEYLESGLIFQEYSYEDETGVEYTQEITTPRICVQTGLANFIADLKDHSTEVYTYSVTPKERVQRVYGNSLASGAAGISVGAEQNGIGAALAHSNAREARANAIMRQPQIVGYSPDAHKSSEATMGWLIGPRYKLSSDSEALVSFRHVPSQYTLSGIVSVPSWWSDLTLVTRTYWLDEDGVAYTQEGMEFSPGADAGNGHEVKITLPADVTSIYTLLDPVRREPRVDRTAAEEGQGEFKACEKASVIIRGSQLWRSTVVTLGGQQADSISVLPNMKGIIATFNRVEPSISGTEDLYLWTSEGEEFVRTVQISGNCDGAPAA